ncbi:MAG: NADH-quinone oxidoreductase subunit A [Candidatus Asgardarchaeia archaeon]
MLSELSELVIFEVSVIIFIAVMLLLSQLFRPKNPTPEKESVYECGEEPIGEAHIQFRFDYFIYALIFLVIDVISMYLFLLSSNYGLFIPENFAISAIFILFPTAALGYVLKHAKTLPKVE